METCFKCDLQYLYSRPTFCSCIAVIDLFSKLCFERIKKKMTNLYILKNVKNFGHVAFSNWSVFCLTPPRRVLPDSFQDKLLSKLMQNINYFHLALKLQLLVWPSICLKNKLYYIIILRNHNYNIILFEWLKWELQNNFFRTI